MFIFRARTTRMEHHQYQDILPSLGYFSELPTLQILYLKKKNKTETKQKSSTKQKPSTKQNKTDQQKKEKNQIYFPPNSNTLALTRAQKAPKLIAPEINTSV